MATNQETIGKNNKQRNPVAAMRDFSRNPDGGKQIDGWSTIMRRIRKISKTEKMPAKPRKTIIKYVL
jgi:hypothetical protein